MGETDLREMATAGGIPVQPGMSAHDLRRAIRASNADRAAGIPVDDLPRLTAHEAHEPARRLSGEPAPPDEPA
jgi:hypothetical protein